MNAAKPTEKPAAQTESAKADSVQRAGWAALERLKSNVHRRTEYYRTASEDPHNINTALYVAMLEMENAIGETLGERPNESSSATAAEKRSD